LEHHPLQLPSDLWMRLRRNGDISLAVQLKAFGGKRATK
jgi:hypothetical protein